MEVLIVDDQPGVRFLLEVVVKEAGHRVYTAQSGLDAIEFSRVNCPDLIFMDVRMPLVGGLEALGEIKTIHPETDIIIMTAFGSEDTVSEAMQKGALCCISKPFDLEEIKELLLKYSWERDNFNHAAAGACTEDN